MAIYLTCATYCFILVILELRRQDSGILAELQRYAFSKLVNQCVCVVTLRVHLQGPFEGVIFTPQIQASNAAMSSVGILRDKANYFKFVDFRKQVTNL